MKLLNLCCTALLLLVAGCKPEAVAPVPAAPTVKTYEVHGVVRKISDDRHTATIQHDAIPGYMSGMTMDFSVKNTNELKGIAASDEINFKLAVGENDSWIEDVRFFAHRIEDVTNNTFTFHVPTAELKPGDALPDYEFVAEDGKTIHLSDFRGKVVAFTFIYSRCPLPDYCPRMSHNFSDARKLILATPDAPANWQLLTISFDPEYDTPEVLSSLANFFRSGDANHWLFAVAPTNTLAGLAPRLDLTVVHEGETIASHNMRTVVLDPQGRIARQLDGNMWTPQQLADAILAVARGQTNSIP
jgi:protein SCO1/2